MHDLRRITDVGGAFAAIEVERVRSALSAVADRYAERVAAHRARVPPSVVAGVRAKMTSLLDDWASLAHDHQAGGTAFGWGSHLDEIVGRLSEHRLELVKPGLGRSLNVEPATRSSCSVTG